MGRIAGVTAAETRERLLRAAADVFAQRGYDGTRVADIAAAAGVSNGALYAHFGSKAELLVAALRRHGKQLLAELLATHLPDARMRPLEATYLAWLDLRAYGHERPAGVIRRQGAVRVASGHHYHPGLPGHVRLNIATSPDRLTEIVRRMAGALTRS